jgi:hypothetical protein
VETDLVICRPKFPSSGWWKLNPHWPPLTREGRLRVISALVVHVLVAAAVKPFVIAMNLNRPPCVEFVLPPPEPTRSGRLGGHLGRLKIFGHLESYLRFPEYNGRARQNESSRGHLDRDPCSWFQKAGSPAQRGSFIFPDHDHLLGHIPKLG